MSCCQRAFRYGDVDVRDVALVLFEISVGLQIVEYGRHKATPVAPATYLSAVGSYIACLWLSRFAVLPRLFHDQHAEHLATVYLLAPVVTLGDFLLQFLAGYDAERVRLITERIVHSLGQPDARGWVYMYWMKFHAAKIRYFFIFFSLIQNFALSLHKISCTWQSKTNFY